MGGNMQIGAASSELLTHPLVSRMTVSATVAYRYRTGVVGLRRDADARDGVCR